MEREITDRAGRRLTLRRFGVLETLRLYKALGPELAVNDAYVGLAKVASSAAMIDDVPLPFPVNEAGVELLLERLGDDGIAAIEAVDIPMSLPAVVAEAGN